MRKTREQNWAYIFITYTILLSVYSFIMVPVVNSSSSSSDVFTSSKLINTGNNSNNKIKKNYNLLVLRGIYYII